jgi:recombination protein RecA
VKKSGAWYTYEGEQLGQGKENARKFLIENDKLADEIEKKIKTKLGIGVPRAVADLPVDPAAEVSAPAANGVKAANA